MNINEEYATYKNMPNISYKIIEHLMTNPKAELLWKLLKYDTVDAYNKPDLTIEDKAKLICIGNESLKNDFRIFFDYMSNDAVTDMKTILRIYPAEIYPINRVTGVCTVNLEIFTHSKINHLDNYTTRVDTIVQILLEVLNGSDIGGIGVLFFDNQASRYDKVQTIGQKPYKGKLLKMSVNMG